MWQAYKKFAGGPMGLFVSVITLGTGAILGWRWYVAPNIRRKRLARNEEFAEFVFQEREKKTKEITSQ